MQFERYSLYPSRFGSLLLRQLRMTGINPAATKAEIISGGNVDRSFVGTAFADPLIKVNTADFTGVFGGVTAVGLNTGYPVDTNNLAGHGATLSTLVQFQARLDGGTFKPAANAVHYLLANSKGFLYVDQISGEQDSKDGALIDLVYYALSEDGDLVPVTPSIGALTSTPSFNGIWYQGPVFVGNSAPVQLRSIQKTTVKPGIEYKVKRGEGQPFASQGAIVARNPELRLNFTDMAAYNTFFANLFGFEQTLDHKIVVYYQKGQPGGQRRARNLNEHFAVAAWTGDLTPDDISVSDVGGDLGVEAVVRVTAGNLSIAANCQIPNSTFP